MKNYIVSISICPACTVRGAERRQARGGSGSAIAGYGKTCEDCKYCRISYTCSMKHWRCSKSHLMDDLIPCRDYEQGDLGNEYRT